MLVLPFEVNFDTIQCHDATISLVDLEHIFNFSFVFHEFFIQNSYCHYQLPKVNAPFW
jgi:hypothetical protein